MRGRIDALIGANGDRTVDDFHRVLGRIVWNACGMSRTKEGLEDAIREIGVLREEFHQNLKVVGTSEQINPSLEKAGRVADFFELAELMCQDALDREESCGGHFRDEHQTSEGEAKRDDANYSYVSAWQFNGAGSPATLHKEELEFHEVELSQRSYK